MSSLHTIFFSRYLADGDEIRAVFHRHFFAVLPNILFWLIVPVGGISYLVYRFTYPMILSTPFLWLFEGYLFVMFLIVMYRVIDWYADAWVLTDRGIIDVCWSLFMLDTSFTEYGDVAAIQSSQDTLFDKIFRIGDVTLHKMGSEMRIRRMYRPDLLVAGVQEHLHGEHAHHESPKTLPDMHIYVDGFRQPYRAHAHTSGYQLTPEEQKANDTFLASIRQKPGTIDLSSPAKLHRLDQEEHEEDHAHH